MTSLMWVVAFTLLCGLGDALGFVHASRVWQDGRFAWSKLPSRRSASSSAWRCTG